MHVSTRLRAHWHQRYLAFGWGVPSIFALGIFVLRPNEVGITYFFAAWVDDHNLPQPRFNESGTNNWPTNSDDPNIDWNKYYFLWGPIIVIYIYSMVVWAYANRRLRAGVQETLLQRIDALNR